MNDIHHRLQSLIADALAIVGGHALIGVSHDRANGNLISRLSSDSLEAMTQRVEVQAGSLEVESFQQLCELIRNLVDWVSLLPSPNEPLPEQCEKH